MHRIDQRPYRSAVFLDRDGTLIEDQQYQFDPDRITLASGAGHALRRLFDAGYTLVVVTNQSGVARGLFTEEVVSRMHHRLARMVGGLGVRIEAFYYCPHHPDGVVARYAVDCQCRKPRPGMILRAAQELQLALPLSWLVGDIWDDIRAGLAAGCRCVLVGKERQQVPPDLSGSPRVFLASNLSEAADIILAHPLPVVLEHAHIGRGRQS